jgi:hypothetical protein
MGKLDRLLLGEAYDRLVLVPPKGSISEIADRIHELSPISKKSLFRELLPRYKDLSNRIENLGYPAISELLRFCFNETSEYFTRSITEDKDDETVKEQVGQELDTLNQSLVDAFYSRSKPSAVAAIAKTYQTLAPKDQVMEFNPLNFGKKLEETLDDLEKCNNRRIRKVLSEFSCITYSEDTYTFTVNYLNYIFNEELIELVDCKESKLLVKYLREMSHGIQSENRLTIFYSLERIAEVVSKMNSR